MTTATKELKTRDQFNSFANSKPALINAQLTHDWQTYPELCKAAGLKRSEVHSSFLTRLIRKNIVEMSEIDGHKVYRLIDEKKTAKKRVRKSRAKAKQSDAITSVEEFNAA